MCSTPGCNSWSASSDRPPRRRLRPSPHHPLLVRPEGHHAVHLRLLLRRTLRVTEGDLMWTWILIGLAFWMLIALIVGLALGQVIRRADEEEGHR